MDGGTRRWFLSALSEAVAFVAGALHIKGAIDSSERQRLALDQRCDFRLIDDGTEVDHKGRHWQKWKAFRWIPVTERLPETPHDPRSLWMEYLKAKCSNKILVATSDDRVSATRFVSVGFFDGFPNVTHWAELPAPPIPPTDNATGITEYPL